MGRSSREIQLIEYVLMIIVVKSRELKRNGMHTGRQVNGTSLVVSDLGRAGTAGDPLSLTCSTGYNDPIQCKCKTFVSFIKHLSHTTDGKVQWHSFLEDHDDSIGLSTLFPSVASCHTHRRIFYLELHTHSVITDGPTATSSIEAALFEFPCNVQACPIVIAKCFLNLCLSSQAICLNDR